MFTKDSDLQSYIEELNGANAGILATNIGQFSGPIITGYFFQHFGFANTYNVLIGVQVVQIFFYLIVGKAYEVFKGENPVEVIDNRSDYKEIEEEDAHVKAIN